MTSYDHGDEHGELLARIDRELREALKVEASPALAARVRRRIADSRAGAVGWNRWWAPAAVATGLAMWIAWPALPGPPREEPRRLAPVERPPIAAPAAAVERVAARAPAHPPAINPPRRRRVEEPTQVALLRRYVGLVGDASTDREPVGDEPSPAVRLAALAPIEIESLAIEPYTEE